ncbi:MAG: NADPH-dependent glutamate synthase [Candidatus Omnitrophota bacterium]
MPKVPMREQPAEERVKNFEEVALGLTEAEAVKEAKRCLECGKPACSAGCPVEIDIPAFISAIAKSNFKQAIEKLREKNSLPAVCGRVCPQEDQCEKLCILSKKDAPVGIGNLERFAADYEFSHKTKEQDSPNRKPLTVNREPSVKVAVIGSGPSGITCAGDLARMGYNVTMFESLHAPGGVLIYGIPEFRLPKKIVQTEVDYVCSLGVDVRTNILVGRTTTLDDLRAQGYAAFFVGTGAGLPYFLGIDGEGLNGVYSANEFLTRINLMKAYHFPEYDTPVRVGRRVGVIGAGNVAMDSARCAKRLGAEEVSIIYRRTETEMPARIEEVERAKEEGIRFELLTNPVRLVADGSGWVKQAVCMRNELGEPDSSGRRRPVPIKRSEFTIDIDTIVCAVGQGPNPLLLSTLPDLKLTGKGTIITDSDCATSLDGVFAGGDIVTGAATVIEAMGAGKKAARGIDRYLKSHQSPATSRQ